MFFHTFKYDKYRGVIGMHAKSNRDVVLDNRIPALIKTQNFRS